MNIKQKLTSLVAATMPMMPVVDLAVLSTAITATNSAQSEEVAKKNPSPKKIAQNASLFVGKIWESEDKKFRVQFYQKNSTYNGKIVWLPEGSETKDVKNPDPKLRSRNLIGALMFQGFAYDPGTKQLTGGVVYVAPMGRILKPKSLKVVSDDRIEMQISMGFMSRTLALTAVK
jgi:Uncharacterized protein conserved in bacteria (DUF2147)